MTDGGLPGAPLNRAERRRQARSPLGGYGDLARQAIPGYVMRDAPCDVPTCDQLVGKDGGSRTITGIGENGNSVSILIRLCAAHMAAPIGDLYRLLPPLSALFSDTGSSYLDLR